MRKGCRGFTLIEIMIVVAIILIVISTGLPGFKRIRDSSKQKICVGNLRRIKMAADQYRLDKNIAYASAVNIDSLWPGSAGVKDVEKYIPQQLQCPIEGNRYVGNIRWTDSNRRFIYVFTNAGNLSSQRQTGGPFCVVGTSRTFYDKAKGADYAHYVQFLEQVDHLSI